MSTRLAAAAVAFALTYPASASAQDGEEAAVLVVVQEFFDSMAAADTSRARAILMPEGRYFGVREEEAGPYVFGRSHEEYLVRMADREESVLERMWEPTVLVHGRIATVWAPYDFHIDGEFSHCGVDSFNLLKTEEGWKVAGAVFTMEPAGCGESPLGPPE